MSKIQFNEVSTDQVSGHNNAWKDQLHTPHDDMWWSLCLSAKTLEIIIDDQSVGFASINEEGQLIRFYIGFEWLNSVSRVMRALLDQNLINAAIIGTHDTASIHAVSSLGATSTPHTLLYELESTERLKSCDNLIKATAADLDRVIEYYHYAIEAPIAWLQVYVGERIEKGEFFFLEEENTIAGSCEVRQHPYSKNHAAIGIAVNPDHRKKGLGTKLLGQAAKMALEDDKKPICSTEIENYGSIKAIESNGFRSKFHMPHWTFEI